MASKFLPFTPTGTPLYHLQAATEQEALAKLEQDKQYKEHKAWNFPRKRSFTIERWVDHQPIHFTPFNRTV